MATHRQTDKTTRWQFTAYENQYNQLEAIPPGIAEWGWQDEICPDTERKHRQGYMRTTSQQRLSAMVKLFPGIHFEMARNWEALKQYCSKEETRDPNGEAVHVTNNTPTKFSYAGEVADRIAREHYPALREWDVPRLLDQVKEIGITDIASGREGIEWILIDPNWKLMWKEVGMAIVLRSRTKIDRQTAEENIL